jgi:hypothetical protein
MKKEEVIARIIAIEWKMFQDVPNIGGTAPCQEERQTFEIMRVSQAASWSETALESYLDDLVEAQKQDRNLMTEKYARMMKSTSPEEYTRIEHMVPSMDPEVLPMIEKITAIILGWEEELFRKYPFLLRQGRPIRSSADTSFVTSLETYLKGELATYSLKTLKLYHEHLVKEQSESINGPEITLLQTIKQYGFHSLEEANEKLKTSV